MFENVIAICFSTIIELALLDFFFLSLDKNKKIYTGKQKHAQEGFSGIQADTLS